MKRKMIVVRQRDTKDCGVCCLQSIIRYYEGYVSIEKIREDSYTTMEGTSVYHLVNTAKKYGFDAIAKKYLDKKIPDDKLPCIVHIKYENGFTHFMVLYKITKTFMILMDPSKGKLTMNICEFNKIFTGVVVELYPKNQIVLLDKESSIYDLFFKIVRSNSHLCLKILGTSLFLTIFTIISGLYFKIGYNNIQNGSYNTTIKFIIYLFLIFSILKIIFMYFKSYYENYLNKNIDVSILANFIKHIFNLPLKVINTRSTGEIISRVSEISSIKELFSDLFITCFLDLLLSIGSILVLFYVEWRLSFFLIISVIIYILISLICNPYLYKRVRYSLDLQTEVNSNLIENVDAINSIKNLNQTSFALDKIETKISNLIYDNFTFSQSMNIINSCKSGIIELAMFLINSYGFYLIYCQEISLVSLITFNNLMLYFLEPIKNIVTLIPKYNFLRASFRKICDFIDIEEENLGKEENFINSDIIFENVGFSYNDYSKIIKNFNLTIKKGEKIMLKGKSGSGKSTLCQILNRTYDINEGKILIGKTNILDYSLATIKKHITYVGQKEKLYSDTIKNNILFFQKDDANFYKVCQVCMIDKIVENKAFRYDFGIDNQSTNISGGERQRIILARALLNKEDILILDEALSETDYELEKQIIMNIKKAYPEKTLIYITHKKQDKLFDRVIKMEVNSDKL